MAKKQSVAEETIVVILAAGKGTRMGRSDKGKVCFEIDGVPTINRILRAFKAERLSRFLLVVGTRADQVMDTIHGGHPDVLYVYQEPQLGTGHAARVAADALSAVGFTGNVLITMGDKHIEGAAIRKLIDAFVRQRADMALLTIPKSKAGSDSSGRVFVDEAGQALDIIEKTDLARQAVADELRRQLGGEGQVSAAGVRELITRWIPSPAKQAVAMGELLELASAEGSVDRARLERILKAPKYSLCIGGRRFTAAGIERACRGVNPSLYLFRSSTLYEGIRLIDNNNAQREYYLTDIVRHLSGLRRPGGQPKYRVRAVPVSDAKLIQGFNSPEELLAIQDYVRRQKTRKRASPAKAPRRKR